MEETTSLDRQFRVAVLGGLLGSAGAGLGLLIWLAFKARSAELGVTIGVGVAVGLGAHWVEEYVHAAKKSKMVADEASDEERSDKRTARSAAALLWGTTFGLLGLACEHLVAHLLAMYMDPFLATMANLAPAGVLIAVTMYQGRSKDENAIMVVLYGMLLGLAIALTTAGVLWLGWGSADFWDMLCWWVMVGIGIRIATPKEPTAVRFFHPALGVVAAFCFTIAAANYLSLVPLPHTQLLSDMAKQVLNSSGLPDEYWKHAERALEKEPHGKPTPRAAVKPATGPTHVPQKAMAENSNAPFSAGSVKLPPGPVERPKSVSQEDLKREFKAASTGGLSGNATAPTPSHKTVMDEAAETAKLARNKNQPTKAKMVKAIHSPSGPPAPYVAQPKLVRSVLVLLLFALGIGGALSVMEVLKPQPYEGSVTARKDVTLAVAMLIGLVGACIYGRLYPIDDAPKPPSNGLSLPTSLSSPPVKSGTPGESPSSFPTSR